jgi:hypothetical protein
MPVVARFGWSSNFPVFSNTPATVIRGTLGAFLEDVSRQQVFAWDDSIPGLQREVREVLATYSGASEYSAILEYELPMERRRPDVVLLIGGAALVLELKSKDRPLLADVDQASAYARDLRAYHRECDGRPVDPVLVLTRASGNLGPMAGVDVVGLDYIDSLVSELEGSRPGAPIGVDRFLAADAYRPLPSLIEAARELLESGSVRRIHRAASATEPTLAAMTSIIEQAAATKTRHLVLLTGLPGTGKTLVGLQLAHSRRLDDLAVARADGKPSAPAVFLSGNGPLVQVLQYELRSAGGGGKAFVRGVKEYVERYSARPNLLPPEHVLIFDEAQRAFDAEQVAETHKGGGDGRSEPEHFVEFAERVPGWCVVVGLIGSGQEIHIGEEGGTIQWRWAVEKVAQGDDWTVHVPPGLAGTFAGLPRVEVEPRLELTVEMRYHEAEEVHAFVAAVLDGDAARAHEISVRLESKHTLRITRDLTVARNYMKARYSDDPDARFGLIASSRDRDLVRWGVLNDYNATKQVRFGPWFAEGDDDPLGRSCRGLVQCVTEFGCQGLELDATLLAWGTDLIRSGGVWSNSRARGYQHEQRIRNALQLRLNAYRVLLTRGRDGTVVYVPPIPILDETYAYLRLAGFVDIEGPIA